MGNSIVTKGRRQGRRQGSVAYNDADSGLGTEFIRLAYKE
jgi:hypothetical protein